MLNFHVEDTCTEDTGIQGKLRNNRKFLENLCFS